MIGMLFAGCSSRIEVVQPDGLPLSAVATVAPREHGVTILAIDFDPPLDSADILTSSGVTLLVAVENQGISAEHDIPIEAMLLDVAGESQRELYEETVIIPELAAGELRVVRFTQVSQVPLLESYRLRVSAAPVPGEVDLADNTRTFDIVIHSAD